MAKNIVITGSNGFIGKNLKIRLLEFKDVEVREVTRSTDTGDYEQIFDGADMVYHLAGVNRPEDEKEFFTGNIDLTDTVLDAISEKGCPIVFSSSIHAANDNAYGRSKKRAEEIIEDKILGASYPAVIYRLPGVFGKWCKPEYNSVVATFCHQVAHNQQINVNDDHVILRLVYIEDVVDAFISLLDQDLEGGEVYRYKVKPEYTITVGKLAEKIKCFHKARPLLYLPDVTDGLEKKLYSTYLTYLPENDFSYNLEVYEDDRGRLFEWIKSEGFGQVFISNTEPGVTRGNHYHNTKTEKFLVIQGEAKIRFRKINSEKTITYKVSGSKPEVVDIPPGYTHNLKNIGNKEMITLFWANEIFDEDNPDTMYEDV